jgi:acyl-CoA synthetase (AMP-forming)/AMP-acid ligase II
MDSYWHNEKEVRHHALMAVGAHIPQTAKVIFKDEEDKTWLSTGDRSLSCDICALSEVPPVVSMDEDGFLSVKGRLKDIIIKVRVHRPATSSHA